MCKAPSCEAAKAFLHPGSSRGQEKYTEKYRQIEMSTNVREASSKQLVFLAWGIPEDHVRR